MTAPKKWSTKYENVRVLGGGGQGDAMIVRPIGGTGEFFLKVLRHQNDLMRRKRMHREVEAYRTLTHPRVPSLVDSNSAEFADLQYKLFLVSELVPGINLREHVEQHGPLPYEAARELVLRLLETVAYCHAQQVIHRDIKPDNIVLRSGAVDDPVLVEFGLSFDDSEDPHGTIIEEELGNRFLRLPELSAGSAFKRDPRSDVTFAAAVFLYCLTGVDPSVLLDTAGAMPHQVACVRPRLMQVAGDRYLALAHLFDQAFQYKVENRWSSADELRSQIVALDRIAPSDISLQQRIKDVKALIAVPHRQDAGRAVAALQRALHMIQTCKDEIKAELDLASDHQTDQAIDRDNQTARNSWALTPSASSPRGFVRFDISVLGDELVFSGRYGDVHLEAFYRCPVAEPSRNDQQFDPVVKKLFLIQVEDLLKARVDTRSA